MSEQECPTCGKLCASERGMKVHHKRSHNESLATEMIECQNCGSVEEVYPSRRRKGKRFFCSEDCKGEQLSKDYSEKLELNCDNCQSKFRKSPSREQRSELDFCSESCKKEFDKNIGRPQKRNRNSLSCDECNKKIERVPSSTYENNFCSDKCRNSWLSERFKGEGSPFWIDGKDRKYGPHWEKQREKAIKRDFGRCRMCRLSREEHEDKYGQDITVHHKTPRRHFDDLEKADRLRNLITLCHKCHVQVEREEFGEYGKVEVKS